MEAEDAEREHGRSQRFKDHFENVALCAMYLIAFGMAVATAIWLLHMLAPPEPTMLRWLTDAQVQSIQNGLTGIILVGVLAEHFKKRLG